MYKHIIFDLDGTILNTLEDLASATNWVCARRGWPVHEVEEFKYFVGNGAPKLLSRVVPDGVELTDELHRQLLEEFTQRYNAHKEDTTTIYAGMPQTLKRLKEAGYKLAVLSNKPHGAAWPVVERYYPGIFDAVQGALPEVPVKPDPTLLHRLMGELGATQADTLFVGDSNVDIRTAKNGGLTGCGVLWGFRTRAELEAEGADFIVETPAELAELILG
jgi:phosphoglycolate phosphatase